VIVILIISSLIPKFLAGHLVLPANVFLDINVLSVTVLVYVCMCVAFVVANKDLY